MRTYRFDPEDGSFTPDPEGNAFVIESEQDIPEAIELLEFTLESLREARRKTLKPLTVDSSLQRAPAAAFLAECKEALKTRVCMWHDVGLLRESGYMMAEDGVSRQARLDERGLAALVDAWDKGIDLDILADYTGRAEITLRKHLSGVKRGTYTPSAAALEQWAHVEPTLDTLEKITGHPNFKCDRRKKEFR